MIARVGQADADSALDAPRLSVVIENTEQLMLLLRRGSETVQWTEVIVFLGGKRPGLVEIVSNARRRREIEARKSFIRVIQNRVHNHIEIVQAPADNGTNFLGLLALVPVRGVPAEFKVNAVEK